MTDAHSNVANSATIIRGPEVQFVPIGQLRTTYATLRPGNPAGGQDGLVDLPLRVVMADGGVLEVIDGFKRLERWREAGATHMPIVVERHGQAIENKRLLLLANSSRRTITPLDEALVVRSLIEDDHLSQRAVAKLLWRKVGWVTRRFALGKKLSAKAAEKVAKGVLGVSLAHVLTTLPNDQQDLLLGAVDAHGLRAREAILLIQTYRIATATERKQMLKDPTSKVRSTPAPIGSPRAADIEARLESFRKTLDEMRSFTLPADLAPAEERRLSALYSSVGAELIQTVRELGLERKLEDHNDDEGVESCSHQQRSVESQSKTDECAEAADRRVARPVRMVCEENRGSVVAFEDRGGSYPRTAPLDDAVIQTGTGELLPYGMG